MSVLDPVLNEAAVMTAVCRENELPLGLGRAFVVNGRPIAVFRQRNGGVAALANRCPHKGGPLADGMIAGRQVVCPMHAYRFDLISGDCDQGDACRVESYRVEIRAGVVHVAVPASAAVSV